LIIYIENDNYITKDNVNFIISTKINGIICYITTTIFKIKDI